MSQGKRRCTKPMGDLGFCSGSTGSPGVRGRGMPGWLAIFVWSTAELNRQPAPWWPGSIEGQPRIPHAVSAETCPAVQFSSSQRHLQSRECSSLVPKWPDGRKRRGSGWDGFGEAIRGYGAGIQCGADPPKSPSIRGQTASKPPARHLLPAREGIPRCCGAGWLHCGKQP